ncbi:Predicted transcriptional regulator [Yersinia thracica]|uniref:Predicted transcriptional regulator n=1 Tax=Yersinia thracica TaxID=2890319 RepID=A0A0T9R0F2_9GAMM|nr:winged helix-turn-helix domain-containing protein [Yersinia thracica]CNI36996.1 Predicted transcriptional regulator [Yersinia thracica]
MLFWKKMPSLWVGNKIKDINKFNTSDSIAALKIYMTFTWFSKTDDRGIRTVEMTFSEISQRASLSRSLVNNGLKALYDMGLIKNLSQTPRKKLYTIDVDGVCNDGWCKIPYAGIVTEDETIPPFISMHNRYPFELLALQVYLYLLYARDNNSECTLARIKTISDKLDAKKTEVNKAISYLILIGLLKEIKQKRMENYPTELFHDSYYFYFKTGGKEALTYTRIRLGPTLPVTPPAAVDLMDLF